MMSSVLLRESRKIWVPEMRTTAANTNAPVMKRIQGSGRVKVIYLMPLYLGLRMGELVNLEWEDLDFKNCRIRVRPKDFWTPKGMEERTIPMHDAIFYLLGSMQRRSRWVFTKQDGEEVNVHSLETKFRGQLKRLGISTANLHTWPPTFASYIMMRSGNTRAVQTLLGHKSTRTT